MATDPICGMYVNEKTGISLEHKGEKVYFCSAHCLDKYKKENNIPHAVNACVHCAPGEPFFKNKVFLLASATIATYVASGMISGLGKLHNVLSMYLGKIAIPVLLGLFLGGVIEWLVPREYISHILAGKKKRTILYSVLAGFLMSACSHGILALSMQLYKKGASTSSVVAFLLASPWANLPITILMFGFFGLKALYIIVGALFVAVLTGYLFQFFERQDMVEHNPHTVRIAKRFSILADIRARRKRIVLSSTSVMAAWRTVWGGTISLANMVLWWILLGALLSSLAGAFIPEHFMHQYMGASLLGLCITLFIATIMEICSEGTAPLAFEIYRQTGAFGNVFVFLMAGVVTDYTEIGILWSNIGRRTALLMPLIAVPQVIILGILFNSF